MDVALCLDVLKQADHSGATDAFVLQTNTENFVFSSGNSAHSSTLSRCSELWVRVNQGVARAWLVQDNAFMPSHEQIIQMTQNVVQAAKLADLWGQVGKPFDAALQRFEQNSIHKVGVPETLENNRKNTKSDKKKSAKSRPYEEASQLISELIKSFDSIASGAKLTVELSVKDVVETIYHGDKIQDQKRIEAVIHQSICLPGNKDIPCLTLPEYRFSEPKFGLEQHPALLKASEIVKNYEKTALFSDELKGNLPGVLLTGWAMAIIGHETQHLGEDMTVSGNLVFDSSRCLNVANETTSCRNLALEASSELLFEQLVSQLTGQTLVLDAPIAWIRRNQHLLDVEFQIVYFLLNGKISKFYRPCVIRFDLQKMWSFCRYSAHPIVRVAFKCGTGIANFQAPAAFFEPSEYVCISAF